MAASRSDLGRAVAETESPRDTSGEFYSQLYLRLLSLGNVCAYIISWFGMILPAVILGV